MKERKTYFRALRILAKSKGYGSSIVKALDAAFKEEMPFPHNKTIEAYIVYSLAKCYFRNYKAFVKNIYFKKGVAKFVLYSLEMNMTDEGREAYEEIKEGWINELKRK